MFTLKKRLRHASSIELLHIRFAINTDIQRDSHIGTCFLQIALDESGGDAKCLVSKCSDCSCRLIVRNLLRGDVNDKEENNPPKCKFGFGTGGVGTT